MTAEGILFLREARTEQEERFKMSEPVGQKISVGVCWKNLTLQLIAWQV